MRMRKNKKKTYKSKGKKKKVKNKEGIVILCILNGKLKERSCVSSSESRLRSLFLLFFIVPCFSFVLHFFPPFLTENRNRSLAKADSALLRRCCDTNYMRRTWAKRYANLSTDGQLNLINLFTARFVNLIYSLLFPPPEFKQLNHFYNLLFQFKQFNKFL